ncbi:MAG: tetratricopeptide repeat protein [Clostridiales bacterium]|nr:tetratricopeptide repeat protein [Clostridiales bacterium]
MRNIKLPGSNKNKLILLFVLIIIAILVIINYGVENRNNSKEDTALVEDKVKEEKVETEIKAENNVSSEKENKMYEEAYDNFHGGNYEGAIEIANNIITEFPESEKAYNIRGIAKAFNGNYDEGLQDINKSLEIKEDYGYARFNKALCYELYNDYENALIWYDKALQVEDYLWSYYGKASIYGRNGDIDGVESNLKKAFEIAAKENVLDSVKEEAKNEADFASVRDNSRFIELVK